MVPIIELGSEGPAVHTRIGKALARLPIQVYIYGDAYKDDIKKGLGKSPKANVVWIQDPKQLAKEIGKDITSDTTILLEGRVPATVAKSVIPAEGPKSTSSHGSRVKPGMTTTL